MRKFFWTVASAAVFVAVPAFAQDASTDTGAVETADSTRAFGIEPYVGIIGGYERFDDEVTHSGIPVPSGQNYKGGLIEGVAGVNVPLGPVFAGVEGRVAKGFTGAIDWAYGAEIGRENVCNTVTYAHLVCRLLLAKKT